MENKIDKLADRIDNETCEWNELAEMVRASNRAMRETFDNLRKAVSEIERL